MAISVLQLDEQSLYTAGLALLEQNLHTLDNMGLFDREVHRQGSVVTYSERRQHSMTPALVWLHYPIVDYLNRDSLELSRGLFIDFNILISFDNSIISFHIFLCEGLYNLFV